MANTVSAVESRTFDTVLTAFTGKVLKSAPVMQDAKRNTLLGMLRRRQKPAVGGYMYVPVWEQTTKTGDGPIVKAEVVTPTDEDDTTMGRYRRAINQTNITIFDSDIIDNPQPGRLFDIIAHKIAAAKSRVLEIMNTQAWATTATANGIHGLPVACPDDPTSSGSYGGLDGDAAKQVFWRNQYDSTGYTISTGIMNAIDAMDYELNQYDGKEWSFAVTSEVVHRILREIHRDYAQISLTPSSAMGKKAADLGFGVIEYDGKPIFWDRSCPRTSSTTGHRMYFANEDEFYLGVVPGWDFHLTPWTRLPEQAGRTCKLMTAAQCVTERRAGLAVITGLDV